MIYMMDMLYEMMSVAQADFLVYNLYCFINCGGGGGWHAHEEVEVEEGIDSGHINIMYYVLCIMCWVFKVQFFVWFVWFICML